MPSLSLQDLLRRDMLYYKGRMDMDHMEVIDVEDGKEKDFNISVKNALKLRSVAGDEVHLLCAKKPEHKERWLRAFADERIQVLHDRETGQTPLNSVYKASIVQHQVSGWLPGWAGSLCVQSVCSPVLSKALSSCSHFFPPSEHLVHKPV